jgi:hypothetical protein
MTDFLFVPHKRITLFALPVTHPITKKENNEPE